MPIYDIAGLRVEMSPAYPTLQRQAAAYLSPDQTAGADMTVAVSDAFLAQKQAENPHLTLDDCEYIWFGSQFYRKLLSFDGFMLHASAVMLDGRAYLFSAPSGTGKSTHTQLWLRHFGERAAILNDDKPALRRIGGTFFACGTPFSGKVDLSRPCIVPLGGVCLLHRAEQNTVRRLGTAQALPKIFNQTIRPQDGGAMDRLLSLLDGFFRSVAVFEMGCNISTEAVQTAYGAMKGEAQ